MPLESVSTGRRVSEFLIPPIFFPKDNYYIGYSIMFNYYGFTDQLILPVYKKYNGKVFYVATSNADRSPELDYLATIHHGKWVEKCFNADKMVEKYIKVYQ